MVGVNGFDYVHPDDVRRVSDSLADLLEGPGARPPIESRLRHADGSWRYFESIANNLLDDPVVRGIVINSRDITERKRAEEALAEALQAKKAFITDASHELRTPLTVLRGNAELGLRTECERDHGEIFAKIMDQSDRTLRIVEDLLFLALYDSGSFPLELKTIPAEPFLQELAALAESLARERGASLRSTVDGEGWLRLDPGRIEQAVLALVDNAAKYSPAGEQITFAATTRSGELCIEVADRGPGIPETELPRVFERFYRSKAQARKQPGSGLGLPIAKTIVEMHGGRIEVASRVDHGTKVSLYLPLIQEPGSVTGLARWAE